MGTGLIKQVDIDLQGINNLGDVPEHDVVGTEPLRPGLH